MNAIPPDGLDDQVSARRAGWRAIIVLLLLYALSLVDRQILNLLVDPIKADLGISDVQMALLQGFAFAAFYTLCGVPIGWAADRINRRLLILLGVVVWALATAACGLAQNYNQLLIARFTVGAGEAALLPATYSILSDLFSRKQLTQAMSIFSIGAMIGSGFALLIGGLVVTFSLSGGAVSIGGWLSLEPWQVVFLLIGLPGLPMALLVFLFPEPARKVHKEEGDQPERVMPFLVARRALLFRHFTGFSLICLVSYASNSWSPTYISRRFDLPMSQIGLVFGSATLIFGIAGFLISGKIVGNAFARGVHDAHFRYPAIGALLLAVTSTMATIVPSPIVAMTLFGANTLFTTVAAVSGAALQLFTPAGLRGRVSALFLVAFNMLGAGMGPLAVGLVSEHLLPGSTLAQALRIVFAAGCVLAFALLWNGRRHLRAEFAKNS